MQEETKTNNWNHEETGDLAPVKPLLLDGLSNRPQIGSLQDIERIEAQPYQQAVPVANMLGFFERSAQLFGQRPAIRQLASGNPDDPASTLTYGELFDRIKQAANLFHALGVSENDAVVIMLPPMTEAHLALWGAEIAGRACPINYMLDTAHVIELVRASQAKVIVALGPDADFEIWQKAQDIAAQMPGVRLVGVGAPELERDESFNALLDAQPTRLIFDRQITPSTVAAYYHTGGTTGAPKLAMHTHGNQVHTSWFGGLFYGMASSDVVVSGFPLFHVAGAFVFGAACFCAGAMLVIPPRLGMRHKGFIANYWRFVERDRVTYLVAVPTVMGALLQVPLKGENIESVKALYTGGSPLPSELALAFERTFAVPVRNILGMTESAGLIAIEPLAAPRQPMSCGLRLPYTRVFAAPIEAGEPNLERRCAANEPGVIVISGPSISPGYSEQKRNKGSFSSAGELISGDLGHLDEQGHITLTGRAKDVIIRGAHNIDPNLIEEAFMKHPQVMACAAVGEPDAYAGELPVVFLSLAEGAVESAQEILQEIAPHIFEPAAVPKRVTVLDALPTTAIGKIFKPALRLMAVEHAYHDALSNLSLGAERWRIEAVQTAGGMHAIVHLWATADRANAQAHIQSTLGRFAIPFEINWH